MRYYPLRKIFRRESFTVLLDICSNIIQDRISEIKDAATRSGFVRKDKFHITVIGRRIGLEIKNILDDADAPEIKGLIDQMDWGFEFLPERFHIRKKYTGDEREEETRESIIQMVCLPALEAFYQELNVIFQTDFIPPPPHITLFVKGDNPKTSKMGVGLYSADDLRRYTVDLFGK